jgi:hypothetical protein
MPLPEQPGVDYLPGTAAEVCGPGANPPKNPLVWAGTRPYKVGTYHVGIRANSEDTHETLRVAFAAYALPEGTPAPTNFSVVLGGGGEARGLDLLFEANTIVVRSRSARRVLYGLAAYLSHLTASPDGDGLLRLYDRVGVREGKAMILPGVMLNDLEHVQAALARMGVAIADEPLTAVDLESLEVVVPEPTVAPDPAVIDALPPAGSWRTELPRVEPGRYPIERWFIWTADREASTMSRAEAVTKAMQVMACAPERLVEEAGRMSELFQRMNPTPISFEDAKEFVAAVGAALQS